jgi:TRAP-type C4-dicarboxylate transport system permease small subunit
MRTLVRAYDRLILAMAWLSGALMAAMFVAIVVDVVLRNLGLQSSAHLFSFTEYALLMIPCFGAPWLVRERGHVFVEIGLNALPAAARRHAVAAIGVACVLVCLVLAWYGFEITVRNFQMGDKDVRSFDAPRWLLVVCIPVSFLFMATEFARFVARGEDFLGSMVPGVATGEPSALDATSPVPTAGPNRH